MVALRMFELTRFDPPDPLVPVRSITQDEGCRAINDLELKTELRINAI
jgi:hypothetical protein